MKAQRGRHAASDKSYSSKSIREAGRPAADRLPSRRELLDAIAWQADIIDVLVADRNRLAADLAELLCERAAT